MTRFAFIILLVHCALSQVVPYDGSSYTFGAEDNWAVSYNLPTTCPDSWRKTLSIGITSTFALNDETDLVLAIGTESEYFAFSVAYDGAISAGDATGSMIVAPADGDALFQTTTPLAELYESEWRSDLIPTSDTDEWDAVTASSSDAGDNTSPLTVEVSREGGSSQTLLALTKNGESASVSFSSTWAVGDAQTLYLAADNGNSLEQFLLESITVEETCTGSLYDGSSDVDVIGGPYWNYYYPLGSCDSQSNWQMTVTVDLSATTSDDEADVVFAIGNEAGYMAFSIAYDGVICSSVCGAIVVTPASGEAFYTTTDLSTLKQDAWRESLAAGDLYAWEQYGSEGDAMTAATGLLTIDIVVDVLEAGTTTMTFTKNGISQTVEYASTWNGDDVNLYIGADDASTENFVLSEVTVSSDQCSALIEYDGSSSYTFNAQDEWAVSYPLTTSCPDSWKKTVTIDVTATFALDDETDLVLAIGTESEYFAFSVAYDGLIGACGSSGSVIVTPSSGNALYQSTTPLAEVYQTAWRRDLIPTGEPCEWEAITTSDSEAGENTSPLTVEVSRDGGGSQTLLTLTKNGESASVSFSSTWVAGDGQMLYLAADNGNSLEQFLLESITVEEACTGSLYDGTSDVDVIVGHYWNYYYPLTGSCDSQSNWRKTVTVDLSPTSVDETDAVFAIGNEAGYMAFSIAYDGPGVDGVICSSVCGALIVSPASGEVFYTTTDLSTLKQYPWRETLAAGDEYAWQEYGSEGDAMTSATGLLTIDILSDVASGQTRMVFTKNDISQTVLYASTWNSVDEVNLYIGSDDMDTETFVLSEVTVAEVCTTDLIDYDGVSEVTFASWDQWMLQYPIDNACTNNWKATISLDIVATTLDNADLVLLVGSDSAYMVMAADFEGSFIGANNDNEVTKGGFIAAPFEGELLYTVTAPSTLGTLFADAWRSDLIPSGDMDEWYKMTEPYSDSAANVAPLDIEIFADLETDQTLVTMSKNGQSASRLYSSTWSSFEDGMLYMSSDTSTEIFKLSGLTFSTECTDLNLPTNAPTLSPTQMTDAPSANTPSPTSVTANPTIVTDSPTSLTDSPSMSPTLAGCRYGFEEFVDVCMDGVVPGDFETARAGNEAAIVEAVTDNAKTPQSHLTLTVLVIFTVVNVLATTLILVVYHLWCSTRGQRTKTGYKVVMAGDATEASDIDENKELIEL